MSCRLVVEDFLALQLFSFLFDEAGPIRFSFDEVALGVFVEIVAHAFAVLKEEATLDDLKGLRIDFNELVSGNSKGAVAAESGLIF